MPTHVNSNPSTSDCSSKDQQSLTDQLQMTKSSSNRLREKRGSGQSSLSSSNSSSTSNCDGDLSLLSSNAADYDHIRNTTLMFFLDRLFIASKDGKEARTLHDLSCLFGTKDFTKEMRQIVGASRNGLRKFLQSYPSLFTIEGDKVYLTQLRQDSTQTSRDYNREAVDYFTQKLNQFGASLVPIKNLFGYRSQASQEVRHVSGKNTREFKQFLRTHEDVFEILADEHVILKSALKELEARGESLPLEAISKSLADEGDCDSDDMIAMDPYLNKQFAHLIEETLRKMLEELAQSNQSTGETVNEADKENNNNDKPSNNCEQYRVTLEHLHEKILQECKNPLFLKMVKTIEDLKVFLRMHPKIFKRFKSSSSEAEDEMNSVVESDQSIEAKASNQRDYVTLLTDEERRELELQTYPSSSMNNQPSSLSISRQHSTLGRSNTAGSNLSELCQPTSLPPMQQQSVKLNPDPTTVKPSAPAATTTTTTTTTSQQDLSQNDNSRQIASPKRESQYNLNKRNSSALRANAPPFVPTISGKTPVQATVSNKISSPRHQTIQRSSSGLTSAAGQQQRQSIIDPRQALRAHLMKASAENAANGLYSPSKQSNGSLYQQTKSLVHQPMQPLNNNISTVNSCEDLRTRTVNIVREASNIITRIMTTTDAVAFDCKGYNLGFNGEITLIQFGFIPRTQESQEASSVSKATQGSVYAAQAAGDKPTSDNTNKPIKPEVCIFDLITNPELAYCLKPLLESDQIVKIVHDVRNKSNALHAQFDIILNHVFDTQVANLVIQQQETGKPAYKSRYISMSKLCEVYGDESLMKYRNLIKSKTRHSAGNASSANSSSMNRSKDVNYWRTRPLNDAMIYESTLDVYCLVGGVYQNLKSKIKPEYKPLFEQLNLEGVLARIKPDEIRCVKKERKIDLEVIELKRKLYSGNTSSIVLSNREIRLLRHIDLTDEVRQKIQHCKKVAKKLERLDMKAAQAQASQSLPAENASSSSSLDTSEQNELAKMAPTNSMETTTSTTNSIQAKGSDETKQLTASEQTDLEMSNLMDDSMFDELKDTMIESSSLLKSLEDECDDVEMSHHQHEHHHHHNGSHQSGSDCCNCQCHRSLTETVGSGSVEKISLKSNASSTNTSNDEDEAGCTGSRAVDMAIQCDLLS